MQVLHPKGLLHLLGLKDHFLKFIEQGGEGDQNDALLRLLQESSGEKKATMAFAIAHTEELVNLINLTQKTFEPIGTPFFLALQTLSCC